MERLKNFLSEVTAVVTLLAGIITVLAGIALFFKAPDASLFLTFSIPIFIIGALLLSFVIKDGWLRFFGQAFSGIPF